MDDLSLKSTPSWPEDAVSATPTDSEDGIPNGKTEKTNEVLSLLPKGKKTMHVGRLADTRCCRFPASIPFIIGNEFCERFNYYGIRAIMVLYLTRHLSYSDDTGTALYHVFTMLAYFTPLIGAIIADSWWGKFRTILYLSIVYAIGGIFISLTALPIEEPANRYVPFIGFLLVAFGTGGIKPCVAAFGGDQFDMTDPDEALLRQKFFSFFYFSINAGSVISIFLTPILRGDVQCYDDDCYPLAFGVPAALMVIAIVIFILGSPMYKRQNPEGNVVVSVIKCIWAAARSKGKDERFLDRAQSRGFSPDFISDVRKALKVLIIFLPLPVFWALFDQQGSRWTLQAAQMNGDIGFATLKPDQMSAINPVFILLFIPIFETVIYPCLRRCRIPMRPLQRMGIGMIFAGAAFVVAGFVQISIDNAAYKGPPSSASSVRFINAYPNNVTVQMGNPSNPLIVNTNLSFAEASDKVEIPSGLFYAFISTSDEQQRNVSLNLTGGYDYTTLIAGNGSAILVEQLVNNITLPSKDSGGVAIINAAPDRLPLLAVNLTHGDSNYSLSTHNRSNPLLPYTLSASEEIPPEDYFVQIYNLSNCVFGNCTEPIANLTVEVENGAKYILVVALDSTSDEITLRIYEDVPPASVSILWQIPQYVVITAGEVMFSITGLEFAYSQAPESMKSLMQAAWLLTVAFGNLIDVIVAESALFEQYIEFFFFAGLTGVTVIIFIILALRYKYVDEDEKEGPKKDFESKNSKTPDDDDNAKNHVASQKTDQASDSHHLLSSDSLDQVTTAF